MTMNDSNSLSTKLYKKYKAADFATLHFISFSKRFLSLDMS